MCTLALALVVGAWGECCGHPHWLTPSKEVGSVATSQVLWFQQDGELVPRPFASTLREYAMSELRHPLVLAG